MAPARTALAAALALAVAFPAAAQQNQGWKPKKSKIPDQDIDQAIEKGCAWLKTNAPWGGPGGHRGGTCEELVLYTLYHGGVPKSDPVFQQLLKRIVDKDPAATYSVACAAMCLSELDRVGYQWKIEQFAQFLADNQCENGQWSYGEPVRIEKKPDLNAITTAGSQPPQMIGTGTASAGPAPSVDGMVFKGAKKVEDDKTPLYGTIYPKGYDPKVAAKVEAKGRGTSLQAAQLPPPAKVPIKKRRAGPPSGDNSNTQYAALGIRACAEAGIVFDDEIIRKALDWWDKNQVGNGSWHYGGQADGWGSMTVGGIGAVCIYDWVLKKDWHGDRRALKAMNEWLPKNWAVDKNPRAQEVLPDRAKFHYYYLYGLERAGMIYGTDFFGALDWYDEGAIYLLKNQSPDGSWAGADENNVWKTCFAILFLRRATHALRPHINTGG